MRRRKFAKLLHRLQRFAINKHQSSPADIRTHVHRLGIQPFPLAHDAGQGKWIVGIGKHVACEIATPCGDLGLWGLAGGAAWSTKTNWNGLLLPAVLEDFR